MSEYKKIVTIRGGQRKPIKTKSGDEYNSISTIYSPDGVALYRHDYVNTDFTVGYQGGILAEGMWAGIVGKTDKGRTDIWFYPSKFLGKIHDRLDLTPEMTRLPSLIPNPNHADKMYLEYTKQHWGARNSDGSKACVTMHPDHGQKFFDYFQVGESVIYELIRDPLWIAPDTYQGK